MAALDAKPHHVKRFMTGGTSRRRSLLRFRITAATAVCVAFLACEGLSSDLPIAPDSPRLRRVEVESADAAALARDLANRGFDVLHGSVDGDSLELIVSEGSLRRLNEMGLQPQILEVGRPFREIQTERNMNASEGVPEQYPDLIGILSQMSQAAAAFPSICRLVNLTQTYGTPPTFEGRSMYAIKISDNVDQDEDEPAMLVVSNHHAIEIVTPVIALHAIEQLTAGYGSDPVITSLVNEYEIWIAPTWNPDGYTYMFNSGNLWRKNRRLFPFSVGVDLNRNHVFGWNASCSGSSDGNAGNYKGPAPASEPETQTMMAFSSDRNFAKVIDYHSAGQTVVYGYGCSNHPFVSFLGSEAGVISEAHGYDSSSQLSGSEGYHIQFQLALRGAYTFLVETATEFQPPYPDAVAEASQVFGGIVGVLQRPIPVLGHVTDATTGEPLAARISFPGVNFQNCETSHASERFGRYHAFLPVGQFNIRFCAAGFLPQTLSVAVGADGSTLLDVALEPGLDGACEDSFVDCNGNLMADACEITTGTSGDCNATGVPDECEIANGTSTDCDANGIPDECEFVDCNNNGGNDACDITSGESSDCNENGLPDDCEFIDCNTNGLHDACDIATDASPDCNQNGLPDECDIASGVSPDLNGNTVPDECESDCNGNGRPDELDIADGTSEDCTDNGVPDECEGDCDQNGEADSCDIAAGGAADCNANGIPDACDLRLIGEGTPLPLIAVPDGMEAAVFVSGLQEPSGIAFGKGEGLAGFLYVRRGFFATNPDFLPGISRIDPTGIVTEFVPFLPTVRGMEFGPRGAFGEGLYVADNFQVSRIDADGVVTLLTDVVDRAGGLSFGFDDFLYASVGSDGIPGAVNRIDATGAVTSFVLETLPQRLAQIEQATSAMYGLDMYATDGSAGKIRRIDADGNMTDFSEPFSWRPSGLAFGQGGEFGSELYVTASQEVHGVFTVAPDGTVSPFATGFSEDVFGIEFGMGGAFGRDMYLVQNDANRILRIGPKRSLDCNENSVPDECETDCNQNGQVDSCDLATGLAQDCNANLVPDECDIAGGASLDCDANTIPDECDSDCNSNGIPDACEGLSPQSPTSETPAFSKNRFLSFVPGELGLETALRVTLVDLPRPFDLFNGQTLWVGPPLLVTEHGGSVDPRPEFESFTAAPLRCSPFFQDWSEVGLVHVFHEFIVPGGRYDVQAITDACDLAVEANFSPPLSLPTARWGDTVTDLAEIPPGPPDGSVGVVDVLAVLGRFGSVTGSIIKARADLEPGCLDLLINITDVLSAIAGFQGLAYPFTPTSPDPCASTCASPFR